MKATEILGWIVSDSIDGESLNFVDVPEEGNEEWEQNEEWWNTWCGSCPTSPIPSGRYLYYYQSAICDTIYSNGKFNEPDAQIELPCEDGYDYIYLYKLEG